MVAAGFDASEYDEADWESWKPDSEENGAVTKTCGFTTVISVFGKPILTIILMLITMQETTNIAWPANR